MVTNIDLTVLHPGRLPLDVFNQVARLTVTPVVEVVATTQDGVVLKQRDASDPYWPNQYCLPGRIIFPDGPNNLDDYVTTICQATGIDGDAQFAGTKLYHTRRGDELALIYTLYMGTTIIKPQNQFQIVQFTDIKHLDLITEHRDIIQTYSTPQGQRT